MGETRSYTFLPASGMLYKGGDYKASTDSVVGLDGQYLAEYKRETTPSNSIMPGLTAEQRAYVANVLSQKFNTHYTLTDVRPDLYQAQKAKVKLEHLQKRAVGAMAYDAGVQMQLREAYQEYKAYTNAVNSDNTNQLTIVQFVNQIIGRLEQPSYITTAFKNIPLDKLRGKIPEMGWPAVNIQVSRLSEPEINYTEFGQTEFAIKRNDVHIYIPREDRMEATIDPFAVSIAQGNIQVRRARELLALQALSGLTINGTYGTSPDMRAGTNPPRSTNDLPWYFTNVITSHFNTYFNYLKYFIWNPLDYRDYLSNYFTYAYGAIQIPEGFGVVPFFGLEKYNAVAIISPYVPTGYVYALANEGAYELDGPYIVDSEYDSKKFADYNIVHDFVGYSIINGVRFGEKIALTNNSAGTGTEITTKKQIYNFLAPPKNLVVKNAKA